MGGRRCLGVEMVLREEWMRVWLCGFVLERRMVGYVVSTPDFRLCWLYVVDVGSLRRCLRGKNSKQTCLATW